MTAKIEAFLGASERRSAVIRNHSAVGKLLRSQGGENERCNNKF